MPPMPQTGTLDRCQPTFSASPRTTTIRPPVSSSTAASSRRRRKNASRARSTTPRFQPTRWPTACARRASRPSQLTLVGFYEKPLVKFERLLETYTACAPRGLRSYLMAMPLWLAEKLWMADDIAIGWTGTTGEVCFGEHHESHAASAFYPSPFEQAAVVTMDGVGEWATSSIGVGRGHDLEILRELRVPALARAALFRLHLLRRLQGELRRVQGDGPGAVRRAQVRQDHQGSPHRDQGRRQPVDEPGVLHLHPRADDDR